MKKNKYKIVVLSDLKDSAGITLKSTVSLAQIIDGDIEFVHVKSPTDVVERDNQLSAMRDINAKHLVTENTIKEAIKPISEEYGININYKFSFGNVKREIKKAIQDTQPDIIVLGKRKPRTIKLLGDSITQFVLKHYDGVVMIASEINALEPKGELSLGVLNGEVQTLNLDFTEHLMNHSQKPLKSFKILKKSNISDDVVNEGNKNLVEFVFEQGDNAINNLSKYLSMSKTNLLFVDRANNVAIKKLMGANIQSVVDSIDVSLLLGRGKMQLK